MKKTMSLIWSSSLILLFFVGCSSKSSENDPEKEAGALSDASRASLVECAASVNQLATVAPDMRQRMVVDTCAKVLREKACHEPAKDKGTTRLDRCRQAYCKKLDIDCKNMKRRLNF